MFRQTIARKQRRKTMGRSALERHVRGVCPLQLEILEARLPLTATLLQTLVNPTPADDEYFGISVAVSDDLVVVGAYRDNTGANQSGSAYVFDATTGALLLTLNNPTPNEWDLFGCSVAISDNVIVVGALSDDTGAEGAGSAYVFDATTGELLHTLNNPTPAYADHFGTSVAISGHTIVVGAPDGDTGLEIGVGSAYVFDATTGDLLHTLNNPTPENLDFFARNLAISDDIIVVGAGGDHTEVTNAGSVYVFDATTGTLLDTLNNPTPKQNGLSGRIAVSGSSIVVGGRSASVFDAKTSTLLHTLNHPTSQENVGFSGGVAISGNAIVVGAPGDHTGAGLWIGSAYVFDATTGVLIDTINNPTPKEFDWFGYAVAISGNTIVVGAHNDDTRGINAGSAYVFRLDSPDPPDGDFNDDGLYDVVDLNLLSAAIASGSNPRDFDLTNDGLVNLEDQDAWLTAAGAINLPSGRPYPLGDSNLDGRFDTADLVQVLQAGEYEDDIEDNSTWEEGDWNGDGDFTTSDLVLALQTGLYEVKSGVNASKIAAAVDWLFAHDPRSNHQRAFVA